MDRSKNLHNFNFPSGLAWGKQNLLRCMKFDPVRAMYVVEDEESSDLDKDNQNPPDGKPISTDDRLNKAGFKLNSSSSLVKASSPPNEGEEDFPPLKYKSLKKLTSEARSLSPPRPPVTRSKDCVLGGINGDADGLKSKNTRPKRNLEKKAERPKFSIQLTRKEIEEDFIAMTGKKPPRKPNKPSRSLQLKLDALSPGLWLSEVTPDRYKVNENGKI